MHYRSTEATNVRKAASLLSCNDDGKVTALILCRTVDLDVSLLLWESEALSSQRLGLIFWPCRLSLKSAVLVRMGYLKDQCFSAFYACPLE